MLDIQGAGVPSAHAFMLNMLPLNADYIRRGDAHLQRPGV